MDDIAQAADEPWTGDQQALTVTSEARVTYEDERGVFAYSE